MTLKQVINISKIRFKNILISLFYGLILAGISFNYYLYFNNDFIGLYPIGFIFFSTFSYYYYQKQISYAIHYPNIIQPNKIDVFVILLCILLCLWLIIKFPVTTQIIISGTFILSLIYHNHSNYFLLRNIPFIKNITISMCWVLTSILFFNSNPLSTVYDLIIAVNLFFLVLLQSLLFDYSDRFKDRQFGHQTFSNQHELSTIIRIIRSLALAGILFITILLFGNKISFIAALIQILIYSIYFTRILKDTIIHNKSILFLTDLLILMTAIALNL